MSFDPIHHDEYTFQQLQEAYNDLKIRYDALSREVVKLRQARLQDSLTLESFREESRRRIEKEAGESGTFL